jgi:hypothetical protein
MILGGIDGSRSVAFVEGRRKDGIFVGGKRRRGFCYSERKGSEDGEGGGPAHKWQHLVGPIGTTTCTSLSPLPPLDDVV